LGVRSTLKKTGWWGLFEVNNYGTMARSERKGKLHGKSKSANKGLRKIGR